MKRRSLLLWLLISLFFFIENACHFAFTVVGPDIQNQLGLSYQQYALLASAFIGAYSVMMVPAGLILDRFSFFKVSAMALCVFSASCLLFAVAKAFYVLILARILMGASASFSLLSSLKFSRLEFEKQMGIFSALALSIGMLGGVCARYPTHFFFDHFGQKGLFLMWALVSASLAITLWLLAPKDSWNDSEKIRLRHCVKTIKRQDFWLIALYGSLTYSPFLVMEMAWSEPFLKSILTVTSEQINLIDSFSFIGVIVGSISLGFLSDRAHSRRGGLMLAALGVFFSLVLLIYFAMDALWWVGILLFLTGFFTGGFMPAFAYLVVRFPAHESASVMGLMNAINMAGAAITTPLIGRWIDWLQVSTEMTSIEVYQSVLLVLPLMALLAAILISQVRD
ncbi:MFS transporter [Gammaproteobacteria bacterium]|nr:MFS transporter [Gammaproteobacteria bacterium]